MDAERTSSVTENDPISPPGEDSADSPTRRMTSAGDRLQATMAAADTAAEEILEAARAEARELIERAEQVATDRTTQLHTQAEMLLTRANDLTQQAQTLGEATRELTSSVNRVISIEAPAVTELELPSGESEALAAPQLEPAEQVDPPAEQVVDAEPEGEVEAQAVAEAHAEAETEPALQATDEAATDPSLAELGALADTSAPPAPPASDAEEAPSAPAQDSAPAAAPSPAASQTSAPKGSGSQPPPSPPKAQEKPQQPSEAEEPQGKKRRSLFSRLRRNSDPEHTGEPQAQGGTQRQRASQEAIAEVSPGHQMLARQMLLDGLGEADVERRLREEFRVRDPGAVLDSLQLSTPLIPPTKAEGTNEREP